MRWLLALLLFLPATAWAQGAPSECSGTVGTTSAPIKFPATGFTGPSVPTKYVTITNPLGTNKLAVNPTGAAVIDGQGSFPMDVNGAGWSWPDALGYPPPSTINIVGSGAGTPYTCKYQ